MRGPEHDIVWYDEMRKWRAGEAWDMMRLGLRRGERPRAVVTTTPSVEHALARMLAAAAAIERVRASRGKAARAEPVAALFEVARTGLMGRFPELKAELAGFTAAGWNGECSPDHANAMVWALCLKGGAGPSVRGLT